jgi:hypothetical protein
MSASKEVVVATAEHGSRWVLSDELTLVFKFHEYLVELHGKEKSVVTKKLSCHGHEWYLNIYPRGTGVLDDPRLVVHLCLADTDATGFNRISTRISMRFGNGGSDDNDDLSDTTDHTFSEGNEWTSFTGPEDEDIHVILDDFGTLTIRVGIAVYTSEKDEFVFWPTRTLQEDLLAKFESGTDTDVTFKVGDTQVKAHRLVLGTRCSLLKHFLEDLNVDGNDVIPLPNVHPEAFKMMVRFAYADELPASIDFDEMELLRVANMFGFCKLKQTVEARFVTATCSTQQGPITPRNAIAFLLAAEANSCALLKERALKTIEDCPDGIEELEGWDVLQESNELLAEVLRSLKRKKAKAATGGNGDEEEDLAQVSVSRLRKRLSDQGEDVDGTKEMLVKRLKESGGEDTEREKTDH